MGQKWGRRGGNIREQRHEVDDTFRLNKGKVSKKAKGNRNTKRMTRRKKQGWQAYQVLKRVDISTITYQPSCDLFFLILYSKKQCSAALQHMPIESLICSKLRILALSLLPFSPLPAQA